MRTIKRHKQNTKTFGEMTFAEQARSISAQIIILERGIRAHHRRAAMEVGRDESKTLAKAIRQIDVLAARLNGKMSSARKS